MGGTTKTSLRQGEQDEADAEGGEERESRDGKNKEQDYDGLPQIQIV